MSLRRPVLSCSSIILSVVGFWPFSLLCMIELPWRGSALPNAMQPDQSGANICGNHHGPDQRRARLRFLRALGGELYSSVFRNAKKSPI
jgi:hypothetical protein